MGIKEPPSFTAEGAKCDTIGKDPAFEDREGVGERKGRCRPEWATGQMGAHGESREGRGGARAGRQRAGLSGRHCGPKGAGGSRRPRSSGAAPASPRPSLTYQPMRARQHSAALVQPPGRPWRRRPAGTTSGNDCASLAVCAGGAGRRLPLIGWRPSVSGTSWEAECRRVGLPEHRALPVRAVSGGPGAGGCRYPAAAGVPRALQLGPFPAAVQCFLSGSSRTRRVLGHPHRSLLAARLPPIHPSNTASGRILFVAFISVWPPAYGPCFVLNLSPHQTQNKDWHRGGDQEAE